MPRTRAITRHPGGPAPRATRPEPAGPGDARDKVPGSLPEELRAEALKSNSQTGYNPGPLTGTKRKAGDRFSFAHLCGREPGRGGNRSDRRQENQGGPAAHSACGSHAARLPPGPERTARGSRVTGRLRPPPAATSHPPPGESAPAGTPRVAGPPDLHPSWVTAQQTPQGPSPRTQSPSGLTPLTSGVFCTQGVPPN